MAGEMIDCTVSGEVAGILQPEAFPEDHVLDEEEHLVARARGVSGEALDQRRIPGDLETLRHPREACERTAQVVAEDGDEPVLVGVGVLEILRPLAHLDGEFVRVGFLQCLALLDFFEEFPPAGADAVALDLREAVSGGHGERASFPEPIR